MDVLDVLQLVSACLLVFGFIGSLIAALDSSDTGAVIVVTMLVTLVLAGVLAVPGRDEVEASAVPSDTVVVAHGDTVPVAFYVVLKP